MDVNDRTKPNIINGLDLTFSFSLGLLWEDAKLPSLFERRLVKGLFTINMRSMLINLKI